MVDIKRKFTPSPLALLICGSFILTLSFGIRHSLGVFLKPMIADLGWGRETFAFAIALQNLVWGITQPFTGMIADRFGANKSLLLGATCYVLGLVFMANCTTGVELSLCAGVLVGLGLAGSGFAVVFGAIGRAFEPDKRSLVLGIAGAIASFGQFAIPPYIRYILDSFSWNQTLIFVALTCAIMFPLTLGTIEKQNALELKKINIKGALKEALGNRDFRLLCLQFSVCGFQMGFLVAHFAAFIQDHAFSLTTATNALAIIGITNMGGSYLAGYLGGKFPKPYLLSLIYFSRAAVFFVLMINADTEMWIYIFSAAIGFLWLATLPLTNGTIASIFGVTYLATLSGVVWLWHQMGSFVGVWLSGIVFDQTGSYQIILIIAIVSSIVAGIASMAIKERPISELIRGAQNRF